MTNAEAAAHFASLPPDETAEVLLINGDTCFAESFEIDPPGTNLEEIDEDELRDEDKKLVTIFQKW
jgi:hypothetical protein